MPERLLALIRPVVAILTAVVGLALWGARLEWQVARKVNRDELQSLEHTMERVDERTARIERYLCRQNPQDLGC